MGTLVKTNGNSFPTFPSLFDDFLTRDLFDWSTRNFSSGNSLPAVNVKETDDSYELEVAAPGMTKNDFNVELDNDMLIISAEKEISNEEKEGPGDYTRREFSYQSFKRTFSLPERMVDEDNISANYKDGILHITVPKTEEAKVKPAKRIEVA